MRTRFFFTVSPVSPEVPSERSVILECGGCIASSERQVEDWLAAADVQVTLDGEPLTLEDSFGESWVDGYVDEHPPHPEIDIPPVVVEAGEYPSVTKIARVGPLPPGLHFVEYAAVLREDVFDGDYHMLAGDSFVTDLELLVPPASRSDQLPL